MSIIAILQQLSSLSWEEWYSDISQGPVTKVVAVQEPCDHNFLIRIDNQKRTASGHTAAVLESSFGATVPALVDLPTKAVFCFRTVADVLRRQNHCSRRLSQEARVEQRRAETDEIDCS